MRKIIATILSTLTLFLCLLCGAGSFSAPKSSFSVAAATRNNACTAVSKECAAASYDNTLYLYYEGSGVWQTYVHSCAIASLSFDSEGNLYFLDENLSLYALNAPSFIDTERTPATPLNLTDCSVFCIEKNDLYYAKNAVLYKAPLDDLEKSEPIYNAGVTPLFIDASQDNLYLISQVWGLNYVHKLSIDAISSTPSELTRFEETITSFTVAQDRFYATTASGKFFHSPLNDFSKPTEIKGNYAALSSYENEIYLFNGSKVNSYEKSSGLQTATGAFARTLPDQIPSKAIQAEFSNDAPTFTVVQTAENALLIEVDLETESDVFPCLGVTRGKPVTALEIAQTENFSVLSYQKEGERKYSTFLVAKSAVTSVNGWETTYDEPKIGYATNQVRIMKIPRLGMATFDVTLEREEKITLLGEIQILERVYYKVQKNKTVGYLPDSYVTTSLTKIPTTETVVYGDESEDGDSIFILVYILLGCALIGILTDYLIIRKIKLNNGKKRDE